MGEKDDTPDVTTDTIASRTSRGIKRPRERSVVWQYFKKNFIPGSDTIYNTVTCNYCSDTLKCTSANGTSCCRNHAKRCKSNSFTEIDKTQSTLTFGKCDGEEQEKLLARKFDQEVSRASLAKMIIIDELSFATVEREGFKRFVYSLQPKFKIMSRVTVARDCLKLYSIELLKLKDFMTNNVQRVSLTTDLWTSVQNRSYLCLTAHFIDAQWSMHKRIINFCPIDDHTGESIGKLIKFCLKNWGIERIFTVTVDNASANDVGIAYLKRKLIAINNDVLDGKYLHVRCCARILNLIVKDGLKECDLAVKRIRGAVIFIRSSPKRTLQFSKCVAQENLLGDNKGTSVDLDVSTRWNSTYLMLSAAIKFQKAFSKMVVEDMFEILLMGILKLKIGNK